MAEGGVGKGLETLWAAGAVGGLDDAALVARFEGFRDGAADEAFRALVERHGPMVVRVCRAVLGDGHDAQDAAQAVFLILARKGHAIRSRGSAAPWLHGVARRVALKARQRLAARRAAEWRVGTLVATERGEFAEPTAPNDGEALHEEVARLPAKYRAPVLLCYLEGQTYEEAARQLGCPIGTVRVRLSRARDKLRDSLTRRGFGAAALGPVPAGLSPCPPAWVAATVSAARAFVTLGRSAGPGVVPGAVLELARRGLQSMWLTKLALASLPVVLGAGFIASAAHAWGGPGQATVPPVTPPAPVALSAPPLSPEAEAKRRILEAARARLEAQREAYEQGRLTIDRYIDATNHLRAAEMQFAPARAERVAAQERGLARLRAILVREQAEFAIGRGSQADVTEAAQAVAEAERDLADTTPEAVAAGPIQFRRGPRVPDPNAERVKEAAKKRLETQKALYEAGEITVNRYLDALVQVENAYQATDPDRAARLRSMEDYAASLRALEDRLRKAVESGRSTQADLSEVTLARAQAEYVVQITKAGPPPNPGTALEARLDELERTLNRVVKHLTRDGAKLPD